MPENINQDHYEKGPYGKDSHAGQREFSGKKAWRSPSNIALVKYWGKKKGQIPENPSVSITLRRSYTETILKYAPAAGPEGKLTGFLFEGKEEGAFAARIRKYLADVSYLYPFLVDFDISLESANSFPHSSGIASSASSMAALALCLTSMERELFDSPSEEGSFFRKASYAARLGSGSAARSIYPGFVLWGDVPEIPHSANEWAIPLKGNIHDVFSNMGDAILIVDENPKKVSSSRGHTLMESNPWSATRYQQAGKNAARLVEVLAAGDTDEFVTLVEKEAMTLHSLMMSSDPGFILLKPGTIEIIDAVRRFRHDTNVPLAFTLDAGPNVHLIYPAGFRESVKELIERQLLKYCSGGKWIDDGAGEGPEEIFNLNTF